MRNVGINPVVSTIVIVVILLLAGGLWFFATNPGAGKPGAGQAGGVDPALAGPNSVLRQRPPGAPGGAGTPGANR